MHALWLELGQYSGGAWLGGWAAGRAGGWLGRVACWLWGSAARDARARMPCPRPDAPPVTPPLTHLPNAELRVEDVLSEVTDLLAPADPAAITPAGEHRGRGARRSQTSKLLWFAVRWRVGGGTAR